MTAEELAKLMRDAQADAERITGIRQVRFDAELNCVVEKIPGTDVWVPSELPHFMPMHPDDPEGEIQ
jgi:hypothetical protein